MNKAVAIAILVLAVFAVGFATSQQNAFIGPRVAAKVSLANQTGNISPTTILTPQTDGIFRVSVYETMITQGAGFAVELGWTDEAGGETAVIGSTVRGSIPPHAYCVSTAGTPT
jgi:hypothetical protein